MTAQFLFITAQIGYHCTLELGMTTSLKFLSALKSPGLGPTQHTFRRVADEASKAETALSGSAILFSTKQCSESECTIVLYKKINLFGTVGLLYCIL